MVPFAAVLEPPEWNRNPASVAGAYRQVEERRGIAGAAAIL